MTHGVLGRVNSLFLFKQKTAYEIKECDWSSGMCSSDLIVARHTAWKLPANKNGRQPDGNNPFQRIQQKRGDAKTLRARARHVGRPDVAASGEPNIFSAKNPDEQISKRNRAEKIGNDRNDEVKSCHGSHASLEHEPLELGVL